MNNDNFLIEDSDLELARVICSTIEDSDIRNRAVANALASDIASKYFTEVEVDTESGLHKIAHVLNKIDIADVYVKDSYIDVRLYFENEPLFIPKEHFDRNLLPVAYMFIKLEQGLSGGLVTGFVLPSAVNTNSEYNGYYQVTEDDLISYYDIEPLLVQNYTDDTPDDFEKQIFDYLDEKLENENEFYRVLLASKYSRASLKNAANVKTIFNFVSIAEVENVALPETTKLEVDTSEVKELEAFDSDTNVELSLDIDNNDSFEPLEEVDNINKNDNEEFSLIDEPTLEIEEFNDLSSESEKLVAIDDQEEVFELTSETDVHDLEVNEIEDMVITETIELAKDSEQDSSQITELDFSNDYAETNQVQEEIISLDSNAEEDIVTIEEVADIQSESDTSEALNNLVETEVDTEEEIIDSNDGLTTVDQYSTNVTPSIETIEQDSSEEASIDELQELLENDASVFDEIEETTESNEATETITENNDSEEIEAKPIEDLFGEEEFNQEVLEETFIQPSKKGSSKIVPMIGALTIIAALGYFGYTKFFNPNSTTADMPESAQTIQQTDENVIPAAPQPEAMPVETVENIQTQKPSDEGNAMSIPAIEQSLDASILVSNLTVNWEVPASYITSSTAKRYFTKMGKIIQLNLKTELLLLSKPPITNKIMVELEFDKNNKKFKIKGITATSGEKLVDSVIEQTVKNALDLNLKTNLSSFGTMPGNPVLIIRL